jgi:hypothetical protein
MGAAKSGGQEVRGGEVFVECAQKTDFPVLDFSGRTTTSPCEGENGFWRKECKSLGSKDGGWVYTEHDRGSARWKFRFMTFCPTLLSIAL